MWGWGERAYTAQKDCICMLHMYSLFLLNYMFGHCHKHIVQLIAQCECKLEHSEIQQNLPIGVIRCASAKGSPREPAMDTVSSQWKLEER